MSDFECKMAFGGLGFRHIMVKIMVCLIGIGPMKDKILVTSVSNHVEDN